MVQKVALYNRYENNASDHRWLILGSKKQTQDHGLLCEQENNRQDGNKSGAFRGCSKQNRTGSAGICNRERGKMKRISITIFLLASIVSIFLIRPIPAAAVCQGDSAITELVSAICWDCLFPIWFAGAEIAEGSHVNDEPEEEADPICMCPIEYPPY